MNMTPRDTMYKDYVQLVRIVATPLLSDMTIIPASKLPNKIAGNATLNRKLSKAAIRLALQTPVPGRGGIATKNKRAKAPYFFYLGTMLFYGTSGDLIYNTLEQLSSP